MNRDAAKSILLRYRPSATEAEDPQMAEALAFVRQDTELRLWFEQYLAQQAALRMKFQQIMPPSGLREQIISGHRAILRARDVRRRLVMAGVVGLFLVALAVWWVPQRMKSEDDLSIYRNRMVRVALTGYAPDLATNDMGQIRSYLAQRQAPADYVLPAGLQVAPVTGCAVETWLDRKVTMVCFRTGKPLAFGAQNDLWLFVVDRSALKHPLDPKAPELVRVRRLTTAIWIDGQHIYLLGVAGDEKMLKQYLAGS
jgi:hypothetical protein